MPTRYALLSGRAYLEDLRFYESGNNDSLLVLARSRLANRGQNDRVGLVNTSNDC